MGESRNTISVTLQNKGTSITEEEHVATSVRPSSIAMSPDLVQPEPAISPSAKKLGSLMKIGSFKKIKKVSKKLSANVQTSFRDLESSMQAESKLGLHIYGN